MGYDVFAYPLLVFPLSWLTLWLATRFGASVLRRSRKLESAVREDLSTVLVTTLTLSGLIIGFSFSMAIKLSRGRYFLKGATGTFGRLRGKIIFAALVGLC